MTARSKLRLRIKAALSVWILLLASLYMFEYKGLYPVQEALARAKVGFRPHRVNHSFASTGIPYIFTIATSKDISSLRNLVGSLHKTNSLLASSMKVYGLDLGRLHVEEIKLWSMVDYESSESVSIGGLEMLRMTLLRRICRVRKVCLFISPDTLVGTGLEKVFQTIERDGVVFARSESSVLLHGYLEDSSYFKSHQACLTLGSCMNAAIESLKPVAEFNVSEITRTRRRNEQPHYCEIQMRDDIAKVQHTPMTHDSGRRVIALGVPTKSPKDTAVDEVPLLKSFLPSLVSSILPEECSTFHFVVYVGYDHGDRYLDGNFSDTGLKAKLIDFVRLSSGIADCVSVRFVDLPPSNGWLTLIWSALYARSIEQGAEFFYQVNDDLVFDSSGWASQFTRALDMWDGIGVAGPFDPKWNCTLLTQSMVSRKHYELFGSMYPLEIKDWYSDFWITRIYAPDRIYCNRSIAATNLQNKRGRYALCNQPKWSHAIQRDRALLKTAFASLEPSERP